MKLGEERNKRKNARKNLRSCSPKWSCLKYLPVCVANFSVTKHESRIQCMVYIECSDPTSRYEKFAARLGNPYFKQDQDLHIVVEKAHKKAAN